MQSQKDKLRAGMSYPLRSTFLETTIAAAGIHIDTRLSHHGGHIFFEADYLPPTPEVMHEVLQVRSAAVPTEGARDARAFLEATAIPAMIEWLQKILALPHNSPVRREPQAFRRDFRAGGPRR